MFDPATIVQWLSTWGYLGIFIFVFVGNVGLPVPEETVMLVAGFLAGQSILDLHIVYGIAILSAVVGDCCGFLVGRTGGQRLVAHLADRFTFVRRRYDRIQVFFHTHGSKAVFMARFVAGARFLAGPMAGAAGMPFTRFLAWNVLGAIVWCTLVVTVGYLLGDELYKAVMLAHAATRWIVLAAVLAGVVLYFFWWRERHRSTIPDTEA